MDELTDQLFSLMTPEMKAKLENSMQHDMGIQSKSLRRIPPDPMNEKGPSLDHNNEYTLAGLEKNLKHLQDVKPRFPPLEKLPCANVQVERYTICENPGTSACSACKLVSYCSKVSRLTIINAYNAFNHYRRVSRPTGKIISEVSKRSNSSLFSFSAPSLDCKNRMRSEDWVPIWIVEKRLPSFITNDAPESFYDEFQRMRNEELSIGCALCVDYSFNSTYNQGLN